jgi:hypothetical protein
MSGVSRRDILRQLGVGAILLPGQMTTVEGEAKQDPRVIRRRIAAIGGVRLINTIQVNHFALYGHYLPLDEMGRTPVIQRVGPHPLLADGVPSCWEGVIPGFHLSVKVLPESPWYSVEARDRTTDRYFAYRSDAYGVIVRSHEIVDASFGATLLRTATCVQRSPAGLSAD